MISRHRYFSARYNGSERVYILFITFFLLTTPGISHAVFNEQVAIDTRAISLANSVTADPPGMMSVHYNPAGLSLLGEGKVFGQGFVVAHIVRSGRFEADPDWPGLMNGQWGPDETKWPKDYDKEKDPDSGHGGPDPLAGTEGTNSHSQIYLPFYGPVPFAGGACLGISSRKPGSKWTFAYANYAPYAGGMIHGDDGDPYRFGAKSFYAQHLIYAAPSVSYQLSDTLSVGLSVGMGQRALGVEMDVRAPNELVALTRVIGDATKNLNIPVLSQQTLPPPWLGGGQGPYEHNITLILDDLRDDFATSFNLGLLWRPRDWFSFGICYQSASEAQLTGKYKWKYSKQFQRTVAWNNETPMTLESAGMLDLPIQPLDYQEGTVTVDDTLPQRVQTGIMLKPFRRMKLLLDLHWANWAVVKEQRLTFDQRIQLLQVAKLLGYIHGSNDFVLDRDMKDTWHWSAGVELDVTEHFTLRMGYERRPTSLNMDKFDCMYFIPDATYYGAGFGIRLPKDVKIDVGLGYLLADHVKIENNGSTNLNSTDFTKLGNSYAGLDYEQDAAIYVASLGMTMPLEVQVELLHHQMEMVKHQIHTMKKLFGKLNPFRKDKDDADEIPH